MRTRKNTKKALFGSILALLLSMSMLVGTTFAWFTDAVSSGVNQITAGNLDIELEYWTKDGWKTVSDSTQLFSSSLWEPGHTQVVYLKLSNLGSLALRYVLDIRVAGEKTGTNVYGEPFRLSEHIRYGVTQVAQEDVYDSRREAVADPESTMPLSEGYNASGFMPAGEPARYLAMVVYMPEAVGNTANHKTGTEAPTIDLGIELTAYQKDQESDSFGSDYDANVVYSVQELQSALEQGGLITLGTDLTLTGENVAWDYQGATNKAAHLYIPAGVECTLDLGGHVITNTHISSDVRYDVIANYGSLTLTDSMGTGQLISTNNTANVQASGGFAVYSNGDLTLRDVAVDGNTGSYTVYIEGAGNTLTVDNAKVSGRGALAIYNGAHGVVNSGTFTIDVLTTNARDNVVALYNATAEIYGGTYDGTLKTLGSNDSFNWKGSSCVMLMGSTSTAYVYGGSFEAREADLFSHGAGCKVYAYGGSFNTVNSLGNSALHEHNSRAVVEVYGGTYVYDPTDYLAEGYIVTKVNGTFVVTEEQ